MERTLTEGTLRDESMTRNDLLSGFGPRVRRRGVPYPTRKGCRRGTKERLHFSSANRNVDLWNTLESRGVRPCKTRGSDAPRVYAESGKIRASPSSSGGVIYERTRSIGGSTATVGQQGHGSHGAYSVRKDGFLLQGWNRQTVVSGRAARRGKGGQRRGSYMGSGLCGCRSRSCAGAIPRRFLLLSKLLSPR
jgi:hypothetical protein